MIEPVNVLVIRDMRDVVVEGRTHRTLNFDLRDVLDALRTEVDALNWCITDLDCHGGDAESFCRRVDEAPAPGLWLSSSALRSLAANVDQVVDGTFLGFPKETRPESIAPDDFEANAFPQSKSRLVIRAVDSSCFEIFTKNAHIAQLLSKRFSDVCAANPIDFFATFVGEAS